MQPVNHKMNGLYCCDEPALWSQSVGKVIQHKPHDFVMEMLEYKYSRLSLRGSHNLFCSQEETQKEMAPHAAPLSTFDHLRFSEKDRLKLRKPIIEKMRRDRINSCIDQLKKLLEKELHSQDPSTKLEKADILEMTVSFLKQQQRLPAVQAQKDYNEGYSHCWRESLHFLNVHSTRGRSAQEFQQLHQAQRRTSTELSCSSQAPSSPSPRLSPSPSSSLSPSSKHSQALTIQQQPGRPVWRPW
uniref:Transcription factor HES-5 n=2 Tax=Astyanax mexicanus TaxID=7994 RepID=A0A3B1JFG4_ASTMX